MPPTVRATEIRARTFTTSLGSGLASISFTRCEYFAALASVYARSRYGPGTSGCGFVWLRVASRDRVVWRFHMLDIRGIVPTVT
jgi:hypothetical protein